MHLPPARRHRILRTRFARSVPCALAALTALALGLATAAAGAAPQAPVRAQSNALPLAGYHGIALTRLKTGYLTLQARINGVPGRFVLDTGAGRSVVEIARRQAFRLTPSEADAGVATGAGGAVALRQSHGNRLQIGPYSDYGFTAYLMPLDQVNLAFLRRGQARIDGVIGADVLRSGAAVIDYAGGMLYLRPREAASPRTPTTSTGSR